MSVYSLSRWLAGFLLAFWSTAAFANSTIPYRIEVAHGPVLQFDVPANWVRVPMSPSPTYPTVIFGPAQGQDFRVTVTTYWHGLAGLNPPRQEEIRKVVEKALESTRGAIRRDLSLYDFHAVFADGYYVTHTETLTQAAEFRYRTSGIVISGRFVIHFMVLTNKGGLALVDQTLSMLRSAKDDISPYQKPPKNVVSLRWYEWFDEHGASHCSTAQAVPPALAKDDAPPAHGATQFEKTVYNQRQVFHRVPLRNTRMVAEFPAGDLRLDAVDEQRGWYYFTKGPLGPSLSIEVVPSLGAVDSEALARWFARSFGLDPNEAATRMKVYQFRDSIFLIEFVLPDRGQYRREEGHLVTCFLVDGMTVVVHQSKLRYTPGGYHDFADLILAMKFKLASESQP